jgi:hypothetical protein
MNRKSSLNDNTIQESDNQRTTLIAGLTEQSALGKHYTILPTIEISSIIKNQSTFSESFKKFIGIEFNINLQQLIQEISVVRIKRDVLIKTYQHKTKPFAFKSCKNITTYFIDLYIFSVYTNPKVVTEEYGIPSIFITPTVLGFNLNNIPEDFICLDRSTLVEFIGGINKLYLDEGTIEIQRKYRRRKIFGLAIVASSLVVAVLLIVLGVVFHGLVFGGFYNNILGFWIKMVIFVVIIALMIYLSFRNFRQVYYKQPPLKEYNILSSRVHTYLKLEEYMEIWNKFIFLPRKVFVTIPLNFQYLHIMLDISKEVKFEHHNLF